MSGLGPCRKKLIGKYSFLSSNVLGEGYSGTVCLAKNQQTGKLSALKIIEKSILKYQAHKSMILCQIEFLTILKGYPNILTLQEVYNTKNNIYLILQLCNTDLKEYIRAKKVLPEPQAIEIMQKIIQGFQSIWKQNIIHRDLKPSNILLQNQEIKIADFGFSMFEKDKKQFEKINVGSPYYMPLQVLAYNSYTYQSDIWALGVIFYEMLTGNIPWKAKTEKQLYQELKKLQISKILPIHISQKSKEFLKKTLELDPQKRIKPQEIVEFKFIEKQQEAEDELRMSTRSHQSILLQQSIRKSKISNEVIENPKNLEFKSEKNRNQNQIEEEEEDKKSSDEIQNQDIEIPITEQDNLALGRMKAQNNQEKLDEVDQLPSCPKKKKGIIYRKGSLQTKCQIFQVDLVNKIHQNNIKVSSETALKTTPERTQKIPINETPQKIKKTFKEINQWTMKTNSSQKPNVDQKNQKQDPEMQNKIQEVMKKFSMTLRSQIHFCRYIFKLLTKINEKIPSGLNLIKQELKEQMGAFIFMKLKKIESQKIKDNDIFKQWLETKQWDKIKSILKQYKTRYVMSLKDIKIPKDFESEVFKKYLRKAILHLFKRAFEAYLAEEERQEKESKAKIKRAESERSTSLEEQEESEIMKIKEEIIILDQLITLKQLHKLDQKYGWEVFEQKSKIQSIIDGEPLQYIQKKHILAISSKLQNLKIL